MKYLAHAVVAAIAVYMLASVVFVVHGGLTRDWLELSLGTYLVFVNTGLLLMTRLNVSSSLLGRG